MLIILDPEEIKNPYLDEPNGYVFEDGVKATLAHAHEVDIDSILQKWETVKFNLKYRNVSFSQFLQEKLR